MTKNYCLFCDRNNSEKHTILAENDLFYARSDNFPVSKGHSEIIPKKHIESFFELNNDEIIQLFNLIKKVKILIENKHSPDAFNI